MRRTRSKEGGREGGSLGVIVSWVAAVAGAAEEGGEGRRGGTWLRRRKHLKVTDDS